MTGFLQTAIYMLMHERPLRVGDGIPDRQKLLRNVHVAAPFFEHGNDAPEMSFGAPQALYDRRAGFRFHTNILSRGIG
jgi:hypothetical protein